MGSTLFKCGEKGGVQEQLLPAAIAALSFYTVGYPAFIGYNLYNNRELVMQDQLLRAKRVGDDKMSNPQGYEFRRRWSRAYYQFRPDMCMWVLAIILRKFCIAIASLIFNTNQNFQMAAMLLVLFVAYAAQVRFLPYMGPATFDAVLKDHEEQACMGDATHLKLAATLAGIETKGRKRTRGNTFNTMKSMDGKALASAFAAFLFDYNTVEAVLIASALLVALAGVMFGAIDGSPSSAFYRDSRDGVMASVLILISFSIVYWLTVVVVEISMIVHERSDTAKAVAASRKQAAAGKGKKKTSRGQDNDEEEETLRDDFDTGVIENANNPLFLQVKTSGGSTELDATAVRSMLVVPSESVWHVLRSTYVSTAEHIAAMEDEAARLRAELAGVTVAAVKRSSRTLPATSARGGTASGSLPPPSPLLSASRSDSDDNARASLDPVKRAKSMGLHIKAGEGGVT